ncbi:CrcB family protein [Rhodopila sp.]|jgi:CrcB protein|uniref:CrcB family protein n=1 Tax=Rhodopila sp. TaxID=2480087 RepID=UPI002CF49390|nr:CrcB family protein [Rhodopila sp.]HVZ09953.1 CrcB family protein [Rhodopila sp.]
MINLMIAVFVGGALGATFREYIMLMVQDPVDGFPLDILAANLVAAFLLGLVAALHSRRIISDDVNALAGAGIMGGMSTFSSFVYGAVVLMAASTASAAVAAAYVTISTVLGYIAVLIGLKLGGESRLRRSGSLT